MKKIPSINRKIKVLRKELLSLKQMMATKKGLTVLARTTKSNVALLHEDLDGKFRRLAVEIVKNSQDIHELKALVSTVSEVREDILMILSRINSLVENCAVKST